MLASRKLFTHANYLSVSSDKRRKFVIASSDKNLLPPQFRISFHSSTVPPTVPQPRVETLAGQKIAQSLCNDQNSNQRSEQSIINDQIRTRSKIKNFINDQ